MNRPQVTFTRTLLFRGLGRLFGLLSLMLGRLSLVLCSRFYSILGGCGSGCRFRGFSFRGLLLLFSRLSLILLLGHHRKSENGRNSKQHYFFHDEFDLMVNDVVNKLVLVIFSSEAGSNRAYRIPFGEIYRRGRKTAFHAPMTC